MVPRAHVSRDRGISLAGRGTGRSRVPPRLGPLVGAGLPPPGANHPAMSFTTGSVGFSTFFQTLGWQFATNSPVTVDGLGYYDFGGDGLVVPHEVGIFDAGGMLLTSTT